MAVPIVAIILIAGTLYHEGSPGAKTGSPLDGQTCAQCHTSNVNEASWISSNIPTEGWKTGETYTITLSATPEIASLIGFEVTAESETNKVGTFIITDNDRTQLTNQNHAVTHTHSGTTPTDGKIVWEMNWKAPSEDLGSVSFYAAFNAADGDATSSGDKIYASKTVYEQAQNTFASKTNSINIKVFPNPANSYMFIQSDNIIQGVSLYYINGKLVKQFDQIQSDNTRLDLSDLPRGLYLLKTQTEAGEFTRKIELN